MMYKKASRLKLRVQTKYGPLAVEQLWDLKMGDLATIIKGLHEELRKNNAQDEDLAFLEGPVNTQDEELKLRYDIVKDIYLTKQSESKEASQLREKKKEGDRLLELIQRKKEAELESLSVEELEKRYKELGL